MTASNEAFVPVPPLVLSMNVTAFMDEMHASHHRVAGFCRECAELYILINRHAEAPPQPKVFCEHVWEVGHFGDAHPHRCVVDHVPPRASSRHICFCGSIGEPAESAPQAVLPDSPAWPIASANRPQEDGRV